MVYLDNNATTEVDLDVANKAYSVLLNNYGNASSLYQIGLESKSIIDEARETIKRQMGASQGDKLIFTSCASESNNAVFYSAINSFPDKRHIIVSSVEHMSVLKCAEFWKEKGYDISVIEVDQDGNIDIDSYCNSIRDDTFLVSIMLANNETGVVFPIKELVSILKSKAPEALFHTDAVQAVGKIPTDVSELGVDFLSLSGHKFHAPKGIGALFVKNGVNLHPFIRGGHQENGLRAGTENIANIAALSTAAKKIPSLIQEYEKKKVFRTYVESSLKKIGDIRIIGERATRLPNTINIAAKQIDGTKILLKLANKGIYVSSGSACNSREQEPSYVLKAMNIPNEYNSSIRVSFSAYTKGQDIRLFVDSYKDIIQKERG